MSESELQEATTVAYDVVAVSIFAAMAFVFLFPCNHIIPLGLLMYIVIVVLKFFALFIFCFMQIAEL